MNQTYPLRFQEILENLKAEYESLAHGANMFKMQRDDLERKLALHLQESQNIQQQLFQLERRHESICDRYEEEILNLRNQLNARNEAVAATAHKPPAGADQRTTAIQQQPESPDIKKMGPVLLAHPVIPPHGDQ